VHPLAELSASFRGWAEILADKPTASEYFRTGTGGLVAAAITLAIAILLSAAAQSAAMGLPSLGQVLFGLIGQAITMVALALAIGWVLRVLKLRVALNVLLVPALYALSYMFVLSVPLTVIGPNAALIAVFGLGVLLFFLGRRLGRMPTGISVAFAILCVIVLVVVPNALYMLASLFPSA
jgi:hypothetical protein